MRKNWLFLLVISATIAILAACSSSDAANNAEADGQDKVLQYQSVPGSVYYPELAEALGYLGDIKLEKVSDQVGGPESIQLTATGEIDFGFAFNGAIIKSYAQGVKIKSVVASYGSDENTFGGYYTLEGSGIKTAKDLIGKKVGVNTLGAQNEFIIKQFLRDGGLTEEEISHVELVVIPSASAEQILRAGQVDVVSLGGIGRDRALENGGLHLLFRDIDLFGEFTAGEYFFTEKYIKENPDTVKTFVEGVAKAIEWARTTPREEVIAKFEEIVSAREGNETTENLKYWKSTGIAEEGGVIAEKEFQVWIDWLVKSGEIKEGQVKVEDLYTNEFNPYAK
ncbi:ABC transporter substrate-binding protein [Lysinibacillus endophyticus]|uniref:Thiamine pyrimidine synthase n=1 Tax=Ureibacillus endophyticus TaxID=1978490 RepID=A0A494YVF2_9BACL|nr:ABC transporter substrate-binding protein [Lysinibacillus endophyticus]MCP1144474.1 ABC transporter substrate-binding protein [Lysinibacillus endophyticus]RKQ14174.1 ABC transporter substrate-binding protein [Lysinibacillus endophyticus]